MIQILVCRDDCWNIKPEVIPSEESGGSIGIKSILPLFGYNKWYILSQKRTVPKRIPMH